MFVCPCLKQTISKTKISWEQQSFTEKTKEYIEILDWLSKFPGIDSKKVGVHGMSEGGRLALNMAIEYPDKVAFVNSVSGPIESFKENQLYAIENHLQAQNFDQATIIKALIVWDMYFDDVAKEKISDSSLTLINELIDNINMIER